MRILHIGSGNLFGGVETMLLTMARQRHLCPRMEPAFSVCFEGRFSAELDACGVAVYRTGGVQLRNPLSVWQAQKSACQGTDICLVTSPAVSFAPSRRKGSA